MTAVQPSASINPPVPDGIMTAQAREYQVNEQLPSVLVIASDTIGERMAGSGIRYWNFARIIGQQQSVTLATPNVVTLDPPPGVTIIPYGQDGASEDERGERLARLIAVHDIVVAQHLPYLYTDGDVLDSRHLVIDLYAPWILEKLEYARVDPERGEPNRKDDVAILNRLLSLGDFFICASDRQRDFWLGALAAAGRLELPHATVDPTLRSLIEIVMFGLPQEHPRKTGPGPRGAFAAIGDNDPLLIWNGGVWNWLDPLTAIRAVDSARRSIPDLRLVFMGVRSPGAHVAEMGIVEEARQLATTLGLLDEHVFFNDWVPWEERQNWLLESDAALSLHIETVEARYAFRTRMLDILWAHLPSVVTEGDILADLVIREDIGEVARAGDVASVATAIERVLDQDRARAIRSHLASVGAAFTWERVCEPLLRYCREPWKLGSARGSDSTSDYLHQMERMYSETAQYARHLEQTLKEREAAPRFRTRPRPDLGALFRRNRGA
jgi:glycosyltransferase involved in cell wall biosynthesis